MAPVPVARGAGTIMRDSPVPPGMEGKGRTGRMGQFMGTHVNRLDSKGRVSVPASFRAALASLDTNTLILRPSYTSACVEAWPEPAYRQFASQLDRMDAFSDDHETLSLALFADAHPAAPDGEGRIVLPGELVSHAGLGEKVAFIGLGSRFQIWEPEAGLRARAEAMARARERRLTVPRGVAVP